MDEIHRAKFAHLPTLVEAMPVLSRALDGPVLFVKRDDQTGLALGGNKTRKLEFFLADAIAAGAETLITAGAVQSNHCRQTAAAARRAGLDCILVLSGEKPNRSSGNLLLDQLFDAEIIWTRRESRDIVLEQTYKAADELGRRPYLIPYGGSNAIGAQGYVNALAEMMQQVAPTGILPAPPDWIVVASSSGGTQAGLILGAQLYGYSGKILGISVDESQPVLQQRVAAIATAAASLRGKALAFDPDRVLVNADYLGGGYGVLGEPERESIMLFARCEGLLLDPVYTGRAAAGMIDLIRKGYFQSDESVLFWHTGGSPALFAQQYQDNLAGGLL